MITTARLAADRSDLAARRPAMDYVVARLQVQQPAAAAGGHTHTYNNATAVPPVPHQPQAAQLHSPIADHRPPPVSQRTRGSAVQQRQRREALEQEVWELKQQLSNEETVHHILERALLQDHPHRGGRSALLTNIPAFIPTKAKELLAELLLVEEEIARLEEQIQRMKRGSAGGGGGGGGRDSGAMVTAAAVQVQPPVVSAEHCKSMFFISQAMDGAEAYLLSNSNSNSKAVNNNNNKSSGSHKDDDDGRRWATTSGSIKSPKKKMVLLPPRHSQSSSSDGGDKSRSSTSKQHESSHELPITKMSKSKSGSGGPTPNKLSERIVKCLVCIFMRLLRSSRAAEMENHNNSSSSSLAAAKSFRMVDTGPNAFAAEKLQESRWGQQDHYGIFGVPDAIVRDIGPYKNLVRFTSAAASCSLDRGFSASPLVGKLREMLEALQRVDVRPLNHNQRLAFWLNVYNTCIMHGILQHGLPSNQDKLLALKNKATINVSGQTFNALVIENFILRQPSSVKEEFWKCEVDVEEQVVREVYGLKASEPNILFALCCGVRSSPALRIYKADRVATELEKAKLEYLQASLVVTSTRRVMIPSLLHSNMHDFAKDMESLLRWICEQLPTSWSLRKSMLDCLLTLSSSSNVTRTPIHHAGAAAASNSINNKMEEVVSVIPLDYEFQYLLPM